MKPSGGNTVLNITFLNFSHFLVLNQEFSGACALLPLACRLLVCVCVFSLFDCLLLSCDCLLVVILFVCHHIHRLLMLLSWRCAN